MNSRQSHAHLVLTTAYRSIYFKMRWMNELAERGLRPVWRTARRARQAARRSRSSSTAAPGGRRASRGRPRPAAASGLRRMEPLEMRLMLAAHDGTGLGPDAAYTFAAPLGVNHVVIQAAPWDSTLGLITANRSGGASAAEFTETFKNFSRVIIDTTTNDVAGILGTVIEIRGDAPLGTAGLSSLAILAGGGGDRFDVAAAAVSGISVSIDGGAGSDGIVGLMAADSTAPSNWSITGAGAGSWGAPAAAFVSFTGIEDLTGTAGHDDSFDFQPGGSLAGMVTGQVSDKDQIILNVTAGATPHTVSFDDAAVSVDGQTVYRYAQMAFAENIAITTTAGDDQAVLAPASGFGTLVLSSSNGSFQPVTFNEPAGLVMINLEGGADTLAFAAGGLPLALVVAVAGGDGSDTILGPHAVPVDPAVPAANDWLFDGTDAGWFNEQIRFDGIENVTGTVGTADVFTFGVGGRLTGTLTGQTADADSIVVELAVDAAPTATPQSLSFATGVITRNAATIVAHAGIAAPATVRINGTLNDDSMLLAPGTLAGTLVLTSGDGGFAPITFDRPASLVLAPGRGDDRVTVNAASLPTAISVSDEEGTDSLAVVVPGVLAPLSLVLAAATPGAGAIGVGDASISYSGIEDSQNLILEGTANADSLQLAAAGSRLRLDVNGQSITLDRPSGSLAIHGLGGSDTIEVAAGLSLLAPLTLDGGAETDAVSLAGVLGMVTLTANNETVVSTATIDTLSFQATTGDDSIRLTSPAPGTIRIESLNATFSPLTLSTPLVGLEINAGGGDDSVVVELASFAPALFIDGQQGDDTLTIPSGSFQTLGYSVEHIDSNASVRDLTHTTADGDVTVEQDAVTGRIKIHDANGDAHILAPSESLTIDPSRPGVNTVTGGLRRVVTLGNLSATADLIIGRRQQYQEIRVTGNVFLNGHSLTLTARTITVGTGVTVSTRQTNPNGVTTGHSGTIFLNAARMIGADSGTSIRLESGSRLLADVDVGSGFTPGDIKLRALNDRFVPTPYVRVVDGSGTVTLNNATVRGGAVTVEAIVNSATLLGEDPPKGISWASGAIEFLRSYSDVAGVSISTATATIDVRSGSSVTGSSVTLAATAKTKAEVNAVNSVIAFGYGQAKPTALVTVAGDATIAATGNVVISTVSESTTDVTAAQGWLMANNRDSAMSITIAVARADAVSKATIASGATIDAGSDVEITSKVKKKQNVVSQAGVYKDGSVGVGLAVSIFRSDVQADVAGSVKADGKVKIGAEIETTKNATSATAQVGDDALSKLVRKIKTGLSDKAAGTGNRLVKGLSSVTQGLDSGSVLLGKLVDKLGDKINEKIFDKHSGQTKPWAFGGAIAVADHEDNVTARVGEKAVIEGKAVSVNAAIEEFPQMKASSSINSDDYDAANASNPNKRDKSFSIATTVGIFLNNAIATVGKEAQVKAKDSIEVAASTNTPLTERWWNGGPKDFFSYLSWIKSKMNADLGLSSAFFASYSTSAAVGNKLAVAGAVDYYSITNTARATVESDAVLKTTLPGSTVKIGAKSEGTLLHAAGNFKAPLVAAAVTLDPTKIGAVKTPGDAVGASYHHGVYTNDVFAEVLDGATIEAGSVSVTADNNFRTIAVGVSAGKTKGMGFNGSGTTTEVTNTTRARIADGAKVTAHDGGIDVKATDSGGAYTIAGGVLLGQNTGFGFSIAVSIVSRDTQAIVGVVGAPPTDTPRTGKGVALSAAGPVSVLAVNSGNLVALSLAAAVVSNDTQQGQEHDLSELDGGKFAPLPATTTGFGLAGAVSVIRRKDDARATINTVGTIKARALEVRAENNAIVVTLTGAMASASSTNDETDRDNTGLAGSFSYNILAGTTEALVAGATIEVGTLEVAARRLGIIVGVALGGSGASGTKGRAVAGSVAVNKITDTVDAQMTQVNVKSAGDVNVTSSNASQIWSVAGAVGKGGKGGYGISIGVNLIGTPNAPAKTTASVSNSTIEIAGGMLTIAATVDTPPGLDSDPRIAAVTGSVGWGGQNKGEEESVGGAGMIAFSRIRSETKASLTRTTLTEKPDDPGTVSLKVYAKDDSAIIAVSGAVGVGQETGIGAAIGYNEIRATTQASVNASNVTIGGSVEVTADSTAKIGGCVVGVGVGTGDSSWAAAGSAATNVIVLGIDAHIANDSIISTGGAIDVRASDDSEIVSVGGGVAVSLSGSRGAGVAIGYNRVSNAIAAFIDKSTVSSATNRITVEASSKPLLVGIAAALAGGAGGGDKQTLSGAGTIVINSIANTVDAHIRRSTVTAAADVLVTATEAATLRSVALAVAGSKSGSGIGAVLAYNYVGGSSDPADPNVIKVNNGVVDGTFEATTADDGTRSDVQAVIEDATVVAGGRVVVSSGFASPATLQDLGPSVSKTLPLDPASAVTLTGDAIRFPSEHGLRNGDRVVYRPGNGVSVGGLQDGQSYFVVVVDPRTVKLAASLDDAVAGRAVPLSSPGSGASHVLSRLDFSRQAAFAASAQTVQANAISLPNAHTFTTGDEVVYLAEAGQADIGGLTSGRSYFVIAGDDADDKSLRLASTRANAIAGVAILLTAVNATGQSLVPVDATPLTFNAATAVAVTQPRGDQIAFAAPHGLVTGNAVIYRNGGGTNTSIGGLQAAETYYVIVIDPTHIQLARSLHDTEDTEDGSRRPIFLTSVGSGSNHELAVMKSSVTIGEVSLELPAAALSSQMTSVTVGGGGGDQISGAGAISLNFVRSNVAARISRTADGTGSVSAAGGVAVRANDSSRVESGAGTLAISLSGSALGASIGLNDVRNNVSATIDRIGVTSSAGGITVKATERARVRNVVVGFAGSGGGNLAFGGSFAINTIRNTVTAGVTADATTPTRLDAHRDITIRALDTASIATLAGNAGVNFGGTAGVGVAFAYNDILDKVTATVTGTPLRSAIGGITVDAKFAKPTGLPPDQNSQIAAMAVSGGGAEDFAGAGSVALNWVRPTVVATIANIADVDPTPGADEIRATGAISITASDSSTIESLAGALAIAGWGAKGGSGAVGASISYNVLGGNPRDPASKDRNSVRAALENIRGTVRAGSIDVHATRASEVGNVTLAGAGAGSFALGGSVTVNTVRIETLATIANVSSVTTTNGAESLRVRADDLADGDAKSKIWAFAGGIGIVIPKAKRSGLGLGIAAAENLITTVTRATVVNTRLVSAGGIVVTATASPDIRAWTIGVAAADGPSTGGKFAGAGAGSGNEIESTTEAFIQGVSDRIGITANDGGITVSADDTSNILAVAGTLAVAGLFGGGSTSGSLGVSVTRNEIRPTVNAFIQNANIQSSGGVAINATDKATINAYAIGGTIARSTGADTSVALAIAASSATNTVTANVGASMTSVATGATAPSSISLEASQDSTINAYCVSASVSIAKGQTSIALTGGGAGAINEIGGDTKATVERSTLGTRGALTLRADNKADIDARVAAVSVSKSGGGDVGVSVAIGVALTKNTVKGSTKATLTESSVTATGQVSVIAGAEQTVEAFVLAGAIAIAGESASGSGGFAGSGLHAINEVGMDVAASIDQTADEGITGSEVILAATDTSTIETDVAAVTIAATSPNAYAGGTLSIGASIARNTVSNSVDASITKSPASNGDARVTSTSGDITLTARENASIRVSSTGIAIAAGLGDLGGFGVAGAGAEATNVVLTKTNARVEDSSLSSFRNVTLDSRTSPATTLFTLSEGLTAARLDEKARLDEQAELPAGITPEEQASRAALANQLRAAFRGNQRLGRGDLQLVTLEAGRSWQLTDSRHSVFLITLTDGSLSVAKPLISAAVVSAAVAVAGGGGGGVAVSIGASVTRNLIGYTASGDKVPSEVKATVSNTSIAAKGTLTQSAVNAATIDATAFAGSVAASGATSDLGAVSLGGAGARVLNKVATVVTATIDGGGAASSSNVIEAGGVLLTARDTTVVSAWSGALAVAFAIAPASTGGVSVSIGVGQAENDVANTIEASIRNANAGVTATTADISLRADSRATLSATAWAASLAVGFGSTVGVALAGAGIEAVNTLGNTVQAGIANSTVDVRAAAGGLSIVASETSSLKSLGVAAAAAISGGGFAVSIAAVGGVANNDVANKVRTFVTDSKVNTRQGTASSGSGGVTISASANETLSVQVVGAVAAVTLAPAGGAVAVGVARAKNDIRDEVTSIVSGGTLRARGQLTIAATATNDVKAVARAAAVAVSGDVSVAAGGADAFNTVASTVAAGATGAVIAAGGDLAIRAEHTAVFDARVTAVAVAFGRIGGSIGVSRIDNTDTSSITAAVSGGSVSSSGGGVTIEARADDTTERSRGVATAVTIAFGGAGAGTDVRTTFKPTLVAQVGSDTTVTAPNGTVRVGSTLTSDARAETYGVAGGMVAIGAARGFATAHGSVSTIVDGTVSGRSITLGSLATTTAWVEATGLAGGTAGAAAGAGATARSNPTVTTQANASSRLHATDVLSITAQAVPFARSRADGVAISGGGSLGVASSRATASPIVTAEALSSSPIIGRPPITAADLVVDGRVVPGTSGITARATATAGAGGVLIGAMGATSRATSAGAVTARIGDNVRLPAGNVTVAATADTSQTARALGVAAGFIGVGGVDATADAGVITRAAVGTGITSDPLRTGDLVIIANGRNRNAAASTAGSGGVIAGNSSRAIIRDTSDATAAIGGGTIHAGSIMVDARQATQYAPTADSYNASLVGGGGAYADNSASTGATTRIGDLTQLLANSLVRLASDNRYEQSQAEFSTRGGAGGAVSGSDALTTSTLTGTSRVTLGDRTTIRSDSLVLVASHDLNTIDRVRMDSGGLFNGSTVRSDLTATLGNTVAVGSDSSLWTSGDISVGTYTTARASTTANVVTFGVAGAGIARSNINVGNTQGIAIGERSTIFSQGNVRLTAGRDTFGNNATSLSGRSIADSIATGLINIPVARAETRIDDATSLDVRNGTSITAAGNVELAAGGAAPVCSATGGAFWNVHVPVKSESIGREFPSASGRVTNNGTVVAGIYRTLRITIPDARNAAVVAGSDQPIVVDSQSPTLPSTPGGVFSRTVTVNPGNEPFLPFSVTPLSRFDPVGFVNANYDADQAAIIRNGVSSAPVYALRLDGLQARGGTVTLAADTFAGRGTITAYGGPKVIIKNHSPNYLLVGNINLPDLPGGQILFTGSGSEILARAAGFTLNQVDAGVDPLVKVSNLFNDGSGSSSLGPALFIENPISNLGGAVDITNVRGSVGQLSAIVAASVAVAAPNGSYLVNIPAPGSFSLASPESQWNRSMIWPGGNPAVPGFNASSSAMWAAAYVANAVYNPNGSLSEAELNSVLFNQGQASWSGSSFQRTVVMYGGSVPRANGGDGVDQWAAPRGAQNSWSPVGRTTLVPYLVSRTRAQQRTDPTYYFPTVPVQALSRTQQPLNPAPTQPANPTPQSATDAIRAGQVSIQAQFINVNGTIQAGRAVEEMVVTTIEADLDNLASLHDTLRRNGITLPAEIVNSQGRVTNADVRPIITQINGLRISANEKTALLRQMLTLQYLGYFNGTATAHVPLDAITAAHRTSATTYAAAVAAGTPPISAQLSPSQWNRQHGGTAFPADSTTLFNDARARVTFDLPTRTISCGNVAAAVGAGFVSLRGGIVNTGTTGRITATSGAGQVRISNPTRYPLVMHDVHTSTTASNSLPAGIVDIIDTLKPAATGHTVYVSAVGAGVKTYVGSVDTSFKALIAGNATASTNGQEATYAPAANLRWQWTNFATITRTVDYGQPSAWQWNTPGVADASTNPWIGVTSSPTGLDGSRLVSDWHAGGFLTRDPIGVAITQPGAGTIAFQQTITGGIVNPQILNVPSSWFGNRSYEYPTAGWLRMTSSAKADYPFAVSFRATAGLVDISSRSGVTFLGEIVNPQGTTRIQTDGVLTTSAATSIESRDLTLSAVNSAIGTAAAPLHVALVPNARLTATAGAGGVAITSDSSLLVNRIVARAASGAYGDILLESKDGITAVPGVVNLEGRSIAVSSTTGGIGSASALLGIQTHSGSGITGTLRASAEQGVRLSQASGDLSVKSIVSRSGNVVLNVPAGRVLNAGDPVSSEPLSGDDIDAVCKDLQLLETTGAKARLQHTIDVYERQVERAYHEYWQLRDRGTVVNGVFTLAADAIELYREQAAAALDLPTPASDAEVLQYTRGRYEAVRNVFDSAFDGDYWPRAAEGDAAAADALKVPERAWMARPEFIRFDKSYAYAATADQVAALTRQGVWKKSDLENALPTSALLDPAVVVPPLEKPNISGRDVTINDAAVPIMPSSGVGSKAAPVTIPIADLLAGTLTPAQKTAIGTAHEAGEVALYGIKDGVVIPIAFDGRNPIIPAGVRLSHVVVQQKTPLITNASGILSIRTAGPILVESTASTVTVGQITASAGRVEITAPGSIVAAATASSVASGGSITLVAGSGGIGSAGTPLRVDAVGSLSAAAGGGGVVLQQSAGDMRLKRVVAKADVGLRTGLGSILSAAGGTAPVVSGASVVLDAAGSIGVPGRDLVVAVSPGSRLTATARQGLQIEQAGGDLTVARATTTSGGVRLTVPSGSLTLPAGGVLGSSSGPALLQVRDAVTLAAGSNPSATTWFGVVGRYGRTGAPSAIQASNPGGSSVITAPYRSISQWSASGSGAAPTAGDGTADAAKTTLKTYTGGVGAVAVDGEGSFYVFNPAARLLKQIDWTGAIRTIPASGLQNVTGLAADSAGNLVIADAGGAGQASGIKMWNAATGAVTTIVPTANPPTAVAVDAIGNIVFIVGDRVKLWTAQTGAIRVLPFTGLDNPGGVATDAAGNVYVVDTGNSLVRKWVASTDQVVTLTAFTGLRAPRGIAVNAAGDVLVADTGNDRVQILDAVSGAVSTLIAAGLSNPVHLAVDGQGNVATINAVGTSRSLDVYQPWASVTSASVAMPATGGSGVLPAVAPGSQSLVGRFVPTSDRSWLRVTEANDGVVRFAVDTAPSGSVRQGHITILGRRITVSQAAGQTTTAISAPTVAYGANGVVTVTVRSTHATPTGPVSLRVDGGPALTATLVASANTIVDNRISFGATATFNVGLLRGGAHKLEATYADQATFTGSSASVDIEVTRAVVAPTLSQSRSAIAFGGSASFTARIAAVAGGAMPIGFVQFYRGSTLIASVMFDANGRASLTVRTLPRGTHNITARYSGDGNYAPATSEVVVHTVT
jgi:hypothetical protein